jgi:hypothetical protein
VISLHTHGVHRIKTNSLFCSYLSHCKRQCQRDSPKGQSLPWPGACVESFSPWLWAPHRPALPPGFLFFPWFLNVGVAQGLVVTHLIFAPFLLCFHGLISLAPVSACYSRCLFGKMPWMQLVSILVTSWVLESSCCEMRMMTQIREVRVMANDDQARNLATVPGACRSPGSVHHQDSHCTTTATVIGHTSQSWPVASSQCFVTMWQPTDV